MDRQDGTSDGVAKRWAVKYSGGPLIGPAWLDLNNKALTLEPRAGRLNPRVPAPPALQGSTRHLGTAIAVFHARALPSRMNGSLLIKGAERTYVVYIPWFDIQNDLLPAFSKVGFTVSVHDSWVGLGRDDAATRPHRP